MLNKRTQIVIGIAILIISAAFLLVGVYFANLQGIIFQNGANSLQLFANNIAAVKDALYLAPSSMTITLSGNSSLCTWNPAIDAYDCSGGSKIYNVSYASGPTLDVGTTEFSAALCFMLSVWPPGGGTAAQAKEAEETAEDTATVAKDTSELYTSEEAAAGLGSLMDRADAGELYTAEELDEQAAAQGLNRMLSDAEASIPGSQENLERFGAFWERVETEASTESAASDAPLEVNLPTSEAEVETSFLSKVGTYAKGLLKKAAVNLLKNGLGIPTAFFLGDYASAISSYLGMIGSELSSGVSFAGQSISGLPKSTASTYNQLAANYDPGPIQFNQEAANLQLQEYIGFVNTLGDLNGLPSTSLEAYNEIQTALGEAQVQQDEAVELAQGATANASQDYSTPTSGLSAPSSISSPDGFVNTNVALSGSGDPILPFTGFIAQEAFLVYGQTAECIGSMPQGINLNDALSDAATIYGQANTLLNIYAKVNVITQIGTYFVGYGGEAYVNGQSSGLPTLAGAPIITDMSDLCEIASSTIKAGQSLNTLIFPAGNGSLSFSVSQGLYNTVCAGDSPIYPKSFPTFVNQVLNAPNGSNVSIYLPEQYALGISNSSKDSEMCLFNVVSNSLGSPVNVGISLNNSQTAYYGPTNYFSQSYLMEFGIPSDCINLSNLTKGKENLVFPVGTAANDFNLDNLNVNSFFLNGQSEIGFSIPPEDYPDQQTVNPFESSTFQSTPNFIGGPPTQFIASAGIDFPVAQLISKYTGSSTIAKWIRSASNGLEASGSNAIINDIISVIEGDMGQTDLSYVQTDYTNVTFEVIKTTSAGKTNISFRKISNNLLFGIYPNNEANDQLGGSYT